MSDIKLCAIYARISQSDGRDVSIESQIESARAFVDSRGWVLVDEFVDVDYSGGTFERPGWRNLMELVRKGRINAIIARARSRIARNTALYLNLLEEELGPRGVGLYFTTEKEPDTTTAAGKFAETALSAVDEYWRNWCRERAYATRKEMLNRGQWPSKPPFGTRHNAKKVLEKNPDEWPTLERAFDVWLETGSIAQVVRTLDAEGYRTRTGKKFLRGAMEPILKNRIYIGLLRSGDEWLEGAHEPMIDPEKFERAQELWGHSKRRSPEKRCYILSGLLYEAESGLPMTGHYAYSRGQRYYYYRVEQCYRPDTNSENVDKVKVKSVPALKVEETIVSELAKLIGDSGIERFEREAADELRPVLADVEERLKTVYAKIGELRSMQRAVGKALIEGQSIPNDLPYRLEKEIEDLNELRVELYELVNELQSALGMHDLLSRTLVELEAELADNVSWSPHRVRRLIQGIVKKITVRKSGLEVELMGAQSLLAKSTFVNIDRILGT